MSEKRRLTRLDLLHLSDMHTSSLYDQIRRSLNYCNVLLTGPPAHAAKLSTWRNMQHVCLIFDHPKKTVTPLFASLHWLTLLPTWGSHFSRVINSIVPSRKPSCRITILLIYCNITQQKFQAKRLSVVVTQYRPLHVSYLCIISFPLNFFLWHFALLTFFTLL